MLDLARRATRQLVVLFRNSFLYEPGNKVFQDPLTRFRSILSRLVAMEGRFDLEAVGSDLYVNGVRLRVDLPSIALYRYLSHELGRRGLGGLRFETVPEETAVNALLGVVRAAPIRGGDCSREFNDRLAQAGGSGVSALPPRRQAVKPPADRRRRAIEVYQQALDFIRTCMATLDSPSQVNPLRAKRIVHRIVDLSYEEGEGFSMLGLAAIKNHNEYTFYHMVNVCILSVAFGQRLGLPRRQLAQLGLCAIYHDMGKLKIPLEILDKHGALTEREWEVMGNHTVFGARELFSMFADDREAVLRVLAALQHHVGFEGGGYPRLVLASRPILYSRIVSIADAFDAMTTKRVYQRRFLPDEALAVIRKESGTKFDPILVKAFIGCIGIYPVGATVLLSTGEVGVVCEPNPDPDQAHRPRVRMISDGVGGLDNDRVADLASGQHAGTAIVRCLDPEPLGIDAARYAV